MKIGIVTYHRANNYGAMLQAYALRRVLQKDNNEVSFVAYSPKYIEEDYATVVHRKLFTSGGVKMKLRYPIYLMHYCYLRIKEWMRNKAFATFARTYLPEERLDAKYDLVVYGSDQIWCKQHVKSCPGYDAFYFGDNNLDARRSIAYAASMGSIETQPEDYDFIKARIDELDAVSVREQSLKEFLSQLTDREIAVSIDPVLLLTREQWNGLIPSKRLIKEKYVLCYNILEDSDVDRYAMAYSQKHHMRLIHLVPRIYDRAYTEDDYIIAGPLEFMRLVRDAEYVVSSSFHGVAFSIVYQKQFIAKLHHKKERVKSLLNQLGISDGLVDALESEKENMISYANVEERLEDMRNQSNQYLKANTK